MNRAHGHTLDRRSPEIESPGAAPSGGRRDGPGALVAGLPWAWAIPLTAEVRSAAVQGLKTAVDQVRLWTRTGHAGPAVDFSSWSNPTAVQEGEHPTAR